MIKINGKQADIKPGTKLSDYLLSGGFDPKRIAVELNGEIIPKSKYDTVLFSDGDVMEIVHFVGGG